MDVRKLRSQAKGVRDVDKPDLAAAKRMLDEASDQEALALASLVFMRHRTKLREEDWPAVARWAEAIESPEAADLFAQYVARPLHERAPEEMQVRRWARSAEPLLRRLALRVGGMVAADALARDEDGLVQEALIDVLSGLDEKDVYAFVREHKRMPARVLREAAALLSPRHALTLTLERRGGRRRRDRRRAR